MRFGASKMHFNPPVAWASLCSEEVVLLFFYLLLIYTPVVGVLIVVCFVVRCFMSIVFLQLS